VVGGRARHSLSRLRASQGAKRLGSPRDFRQAVRIARDLIAPGTYLGIVFWKRAKLIAFALEFVTP